MTPPPKDDPKDLPECQDVCLHGSTDVKCVYKGEVYACGGSSGLRCDKAYCMKGSSCIELNGGQACIWPCHEGTWPCE